MKKYLILLMAVVFTAINVKAEESIKMNLYPVPAVFTSKNVNNDIFKKVLNSNRQLFIKEYLSTFDKYFTDTDKSISDKTKYKTFAVYVHVPRVSMYKVNKTEDLLDIYLPLTMSINFVNMASGETLYSYPVTNYYKYETVSTADKEKREHNIEEAYKNNYLQTMEEVIQEASNNFKPFDITTKVTDTYRHLYILDKGLEYGISKGDLLTDENVNQLSVIYSDMKYSIAEKVLGTPSINSNFSKFANSSITQLKKPKILFLNDFKDEKLYNIFSTALGSNAKFSLMATDKMFYDMQSALVSLNINFKASNTYNRVLPDYFLKLYMTKPVYAQYKSDRDYLNLDKYAMVACGVIFDKSGRVVYGKCANDEMKNQVVGNIRFNDEANKEIMAKNILTDLATAMQKDIDFKNTKFKIAKVDNPFITIADSNGYLREGNVLTIFKKLKTEKSGKEILVPTWEYRVIQKHDNLAECKMSQPLIDGIEFPNKKDVVIMTAMKRGANKANMLNYYPDKVELDGNEVELKNFEEIAFAAMSSTLKSPLAMHPADFQEQVKELNSLGFKDKIEISNNEDSNATIKAMYKIKLKNEEEKGNVKKLEYDIVVGIVIKKDGETIKHDGIMQTISFVVPKENNDNLIQYELLKNVYPLFQQIAKNM